MTLKYNICQIRPNGYVHAHALDEVAQLLLHSIRDCGVPCDIAYNRMEPDSINIVLGYHLLQWHESLREFRYVPYQLEQLSARDGWFNENIQKLLEGAETIWDYSHGNIDFLHSLGLEARYLPMGYHEALKCIPATAERDVDVLFYGSVNERRRKVLKALVDELGEPRVKVLFGAYGETRDQWIRRSKLVLNIHFYESQILETVRLSYLLNNSVHVVTETSADDPWSGLALEESPYDSLVEKTLQTLEDERWKTTPDVLLEQFKSNYPMSELVSNVLEKK